MDEYFQAIRSLPEALSRELAQLNPNVAPYVQELRLRVGKPLLFTIKGRLTPCTKYLPSVCQCALLTPELLRTAFLTLCRYSVYAYEKELQQGFVTVAGGNRVGVAGMVGKNGFTEITSLNFRVARRVVVSLPEELQQILAEMDGGLLIAGAPGSGKTTLLRSITETLCQRERVVCVIDERAELFGEDTLAYPCDVYSRFPKTEAVSMAIRCMNPQIIVCDELGTAADAAALESGVASGVQFVASVHGETGDELNCSRQMGRLLATGAFRYAVLLGGREHPGTIRKVLTL